MVRIFTFGWLIFMVIVGTVNIAYMDPMGTNQANLCHPRDNSATRIRSQELPGMPWRQELLVVRAVSYINKGGKQPIKNCCLVKQQPFPM